MADNHPILSAADNVIATETEATNRLKRITQHIVKFTHIFIKRGRYCHQPRYINLRKQEIFDNLVNLYACVFAAQWQHYTHCIEFYSPPTGVPLHVYAARCYISMWFIDLYVSNRHVVRKLSSIAANEHFQGSLFPVYNKYDGYLALLNASIRPTYLMHSLDDAPYIPIIVDSVNVDDSNPFGINDFTPKEVCYSFATMMNGRSLGHSTPLSKDAMGRPWWLFDWHFDKRAYAWFPSEGNFDLEDVALAYILGTACTPNIGPRDVDDWQYFADGIVPKTLYPEKYDRVTERRFYGSDEVRTMETDAEFSLARALAIAEGKNDQSGDEAREDYLLTPRFKLIDWVYHDRVIWHVDNQGRVRMHTQFFQNVPESLW
ncbi:hypothetical protein HanRHA438_Chr15g0703481 [Helianthus annuus]|uniref:Uncharacterized protein n=1 Tax=Helianthus annuus TaxID=4232 RepID=A0A251S804_HELAN|nr:hypothetical protein HanXRQr2_Chr15g0691081 [Helianthus annuus]KAJ0451040.1 hypothetical protein HanHA300_Chr15g0563071 [Helianthus annuus]KAJ0455418.1 hypothetical protein HanIR_Chr15g0750961 [Helianthus annuus]KAJ0472901.1 hypothetical protein HanHA89_Chr15g0612291 [Helianthus annuus]KAJ0648508.1 hypothetical protein HanLR1_Chr15g0573711 [Helianthus annuus]